MIPDKILYTDGHNVVVTDSTFQVKNATYSVRGIIKHGLMILRPHRFPGVLVLIVGMALLLCGLLELIPNNSMEPVKFNEAYLNVNTLAVWGGLALALLGILIIGLMRERYAVRIATAEGEKNAVVSHKKEYIAQIVQALNEALRFSGSSSKSFVIVED